MALQNEKKAAIRERYKGVDPSLLEVIPATAPETMAVEDRTLNVAAYIRVSTDNDEQTSSFELQQNDFTERIQANPKWNFVGIYSDEGISGTELSHRKGMLQMLEDCRAGKIDYILAKSIARFARNVVDCLSIIEELKNMNPPVGVYFEADKRKTRYIKCPDVTDKIFSLMGWDKKYRYKILAFMIAPEGENFYIFDLLIWEKTRIGSRRKKGEAPETAEAIAPIEETGEQTENNTGEETQAAAARPPIEERFSADVAGSFGISVDQLQRDTEVRETDGFVTMDLITGSRQPRE